MGCASGLVFLLGLIVPISEVVFEVAFEVAFVFEIVITLIAEVVFVFEIAFVFDGQVFCVRVLGVTAWVFAATRIRRDVIAVVLGRVVAVGVVSDLDGQELRARNPGLGPERRHDADVGQHRGAAAA